MNKEELKQIVLRNLTEVNKIINENKDVLSFFTINDMVKNLKFDDIRVVESTPHSRTNHRYHVVYFRNDNLRKKFKVNCGNVDVIDKSTPEGQKEIMEQLKKRWKKYVKTVYPEYINNIL